MNDEQKLLLLAARFHCTCDFIEGTHVRRHGCKPEPEWDVEDIDDIADEVNDMVSRGTLVPLE